MVHKFASPTLRSFTILLLFGMLCVAKTKSEVIWRRITATFSSSRHNPTYTINGRAGVHTTISSLEYFFGSRNRFHHHAANQKIAEAYSFQIRLYWVIFAHVAFRHGLNTVCRTGSRPLQKQIN